jgi:serine/threonine protein kinase
MPELGTQFAGYRIDGVVGRGGMGVVYRATELALDRPVALKLIAPELAGDASFRERFLRESRLAASIDHAGILPVYTAGEADGELFLANRFVDGTDLRALLEEQGPLPAERALVLVGQVADALDVAHARGLVHQDVKPGNVLVDAADHCYLSDFGLTKQLRGGEATEAGLLAGSLDYLAPEQIRRGEVDGRTDQYALGCVLYELLLGAPPFRRQTEAQTLWAHMQEEPSRLAAYPELDLIFARALAKEPGERYESCNAFIDDARAALGLAPSPVAVRRRRRRIGGRLLSMGAALLALAVVAVVLAVTRGPSGEIVAPPNSLGVVDPISRELEQAIPVGNSPTEVAASDEWVWVVNSNDGAGTISRIDPETRTRVSTFSVGGTPRNLLFAFGSLWVGTAEGEVVRVEPGTDIEVESWTLRNAGKRTAFELDQGAGWLAAGPDAVWAGSLRTISRIDPVTSEMDPRRSEFWGPMVYGFGSLWVLGPELERLSPATMRLVATVELPGGDNDIATGLGAVWVSDDEGEAVLRVDPREERISRTYDVTGGPLDVAVGADAVWATNEAGTVARIDPRTGEVAAAPVGGTPRGLDVGAGAVWVSVF